MKSQPHKYENNNNHKKYMNSIYGKQSIHIKLIKEQKTRKVTKNYTEDSLFIKFENNSGQVVKTILITNKGFLSFINGQGSKGSIKSYKRKSSYYQNGKMNSINQVKFNIRHIPHSLLK